MVFLVSVCLSAALSLRLFHFSCQSFAHTCVQHSKKPLDKIYNTEEVEKEEKNPPLAAAETLFD